MIINRLFNSSQFVFDLFIEDTISTLYSSNITNTITSNNLSALYTSNSSLKKGIHIIKDIPKYLKINLIEHTSKKSISQYNGYLVNLIGFENENDYLDKQLSKRNRKNLFSKQNKLEQNHTINNRVYYGNIEIKDFNIIFNQFHTLLQKRFDKKQTNNRYLSNWDYLKKVSFNKILKKEASLHVIFDGTIPISITLNFHKADIIFSHIQTYNIEYSKFNMGDIAMYNQLKWCLKNNVSVFDLAIGQTAYKTKWCNTEYSFMYHIHYNNSSIVSKVIANTLLIEFRIIKFLRDQNIIGNLINLDKLIFKFKKFKK